MQHGDNPTAYITILKTSRSQSGLAFDTTTTIRRLLADMIWNWNFIHIGETLAVEIKDRNNRKVTA